ADARSRSGADRYAGRPSLLRLRRRTRRRRADRRRRAVVPAFRSGRHRRRHRRRGAGGGAHRRGAVTDGTDLSGTASGDSLRRIYDVLLLDLDGTVYRGAEPVPGAREALATGDDTVLYVTNNASRRP